MDNYGLLGVLVFAVSALSTHLALRRLELNHPDVWASLGKPEFGDSNMSTASWLTFKYMWSLRFFKSGDQYLILLSVVGLMCEAILLFIIFFGWARWL